MNSLPNGLPNGLPIGAGQQGRQVSGHSQLALSNSIKLTSCRTNQVSYVQDYNSSQHRQAQSVQFQNTPVYPHDHGIIAWKSTQLCLGGGVAIFHLATNQVVVCYHRREGRWFLPKGRRDPNEDSRYGAEREGFEEVSQSTYPSYYRFFSCGGACQNYCDMKNNRAIPSSGGNRTSPTI